ncbi:TAF6-like RNA polymerase II p300/CBP-associated factor-associated factor 65 kDa subunit 6L, partial [Alligator sinensis]|uniref:TAF6-like RNA polymerase II p300/CBP-associated factor-associated factor 65 kDa subunit 6L n=1 Tax=Alligator sinensis TaxID=38654 RepID=A0A3Q0HFL3_ALLSI
NYYQRVTRAVLGDDPQLMKVALQDLQTNSKIAALLPYFVYVVSGVKSVSHDLEQLSRLLHIARSLIQNPYVCLGSYARSLIASVTYCVLEPLSWLQSAVPGPWCPPEPAACYIQPPAPPRAGHSLLYLALSSLEPAACYSPHPSRASCNMLYSVTGAHPRAGSNLFYPAPAPGAPPEPAAACYPQPLVPNPELAAARSTQPLPLVPPQSQLPVIPSHQCPSWSWLQPVLPRLWCPPEPAAACYIQPTCLLCLPSGLNTAPSPGEKGWGGRREFQLLLCPARTHGDLVSGLYHQILLSLQKVLADPVRPLCSHYGAVVGLHALGWKAVERVLYPHLSTYWANLQAVLDDYSVSNAQVKADGHKVYGAILVAVERLLKMKAQAASAQPPTEGSRPRPDASPCPSPGQDPPTEPGFGIATHLLQLGGPPNPRDEGPPRAERPAPPRPAAAPRARGTPRQPGHRPGVRDVFQKSRLAPRGAPRFSFVIAGRQAGRRCPGRLFQTCFPQHHGPGHVSRYAQKLPMIGRTARPLRKWRLSEYSLYLPL